MRARLRERFAVRTPYDPDTVLGTLRACTESGPCPGEAACFSGKLPYGAREFLLRPAFCGRNSWLPELRCVLEPEGDGSVLHVTARCCWFTRAFMTVWYALLTPLLLGAALLILAGEFQWAYLAVPGAWAWGFFLSHLCFERPLDRAKKDLCRVLRGRVE